MSVQTLDRPTTPVVRRHSVAVLVSVGAIVFVDQLTKAWAWRHIEIAHVNSGGNMLVSPAIGRWLRDPVAGAVLDLINAVLLGTAVWWLVRRPRPPAVVTALTLMLAGWTSNLGDRLGLRYWTAPGGRRGVVDFLIFWGRVWNLADLAILAGSALLLPALTQAALRPRSAGGRHRDPTAGPTTSLWQRRLVVAAVAAVAALTAIGAVTCAGSDGPGPLANQP